MSDAEPYGDRRRVMDRRKPDPNIIHLTANKLFIVFVLMWMTSVLASGGVGWYFAGRSAHETTKALHQESQSQAQSLYTSSFNRCTSGSIFRDAIIKNAKLQAQKDARTVIPDRSEPCDEQVPAPVGVTLSPLEQTVVG